MEPIIIKLDDYYHFMINFMKVDDKYWEGSATELIHFSNGEYMYMSKHASEPTEDPDRARVWFEWMIRYYSSWDCRVYFKDDEYQSDEMEIILALWKQIENVVRSKIIQDHPDESFD